MYAIPTCLDGFPGKRACPPPLCGEISTELGQKVASSPAGERHSASRGLQTDRQRANWKIAAGNVIMWLFALVLLRLHSPPAFHLFPHSLKGRVWVLQSSGSLIRLEPLLHPNEHHSCSSHRMLTSAFVHTYMSEMTTQQETHGEIMLDVSVPAV